MHSPPVIDDPAAPDATSHHREDQSDQSSSDPAPAAAHVEQVAAIKEGEARSHSGDEVEAQMTGVATSPASELPVEHLPEEPVFDGTEKAAASGDSESNAEMSSDGIGFSRNEASARFSALDFAMKGVDWPEKAAALKNFVKEQGVVVTSVIRRLSGKMEDIGLLSDKDVKDSSPDGVKDISEKVASSPTSFRRNFAEDAGYPKADDSLDGDGEVSKIKGRIVLFSKSGCQDSRAARSLLRRKGLSFVEVNVDVFPQRRLELEERTGTSTVPQVFFNESFVGGIDELNALESNKELDERLQEVFENECPSTAPQLPVYGEDEPQSERVDEFAEVVRKLREKVHVKDRFYKMRMFSRCFVGSEAVEVLAEDQYCERDEAVEYGRKVVAKHFFRHVLHENIFEDGNHLYRFLEHDPVVSAKCFNFSGYTNDMEPWSATETETRLRKFTLAIIESFVSDDGKHVDYQHISMSEEFRRYLKLTEELHRVDLSPLSREEKLALFINLYNMMTIHAIIILDHPVGPLQRRRLFGDFQYVIGGYPYSLSAIQNGVLRGNQRPPYQLIKPFGPKDKRLPVALPEPEPLIHFALTGASQSSPALQCYSPAAIDAELRAAIRAFFLDGGVEIDTESKTVSLSKLLKWFSVDFGKNELDILKWIVNYLEPSKAEDLLQLLDGSQIKVVYQPYDWAPNL